MSRPDFLTAQVLVSAVTILVVVHVILVVVAYSVYLERKISAYIQDRIGPNRVGFDLGLSALSFLKGCVGLGQPIADGVKLLLKEDYTPARVDRALFSLAPIAIIVPALIGFVMLPWGGWWNCPDIHVPLLGWVIPGGPVQVAGATAGIGVIYMLAVAAVGVYGVTLGGWASNNKYSFLGGLRATAQMISYEIPFGLSLLAALLIYGTVVPDEIVGHQVSHGWMILAQPLGAGLFFIALLAEANRAPFDNAEAEQELVGGYHTEYSSMRFGLFLLAEYAHLVTSCGLFALLFLGGYHLPGTSLPGLSLLSPAETGFGAVLLKFAVYFTKVVLLVCFAMLVRWTLPRMRYDQVMMVAWQGAIPFALVLVVATSVMVYAGLTGIAPMLAMNAGVALLALVVVPMLPRSTANRRVPMYGSRFCPVPGEQVETAPRHPAAIADRPAAGASAGPVY